MHYSAHLAFGAVDKYANLVDFGNAQLMLYNDCILSTCKQSVSIQLELSPDKFAV